MRRVPGPSFSVASEKVFSVSQTWLHIQITQGALKTLSAQDASHAS